MPQGKRFYIVTENPFEILTKCKEHSRGMLGRFLIGIVVIYVMLNWIPEFLSLAYPFSVSDLLIKLIKKGMIDQNMASQLPGTPAVVMYVYAMIFNGVLKLGEMLYVLTFMRNRKVEYGALTEGFRFFLKAMLVYLVQTLIIAIWSMCFVIPGIFAALNFSQSFFILADDPDKGVFEVLSESKLRMLGNRMTYLKFLITYIPYLLIAYLPAILIAQFASINTTVMPGMLIYLIVEIPLFCAYGYLALGQSVFYELLICEGFDNFRYAGQDVFRQRSGMNTNIEQ